MKIYANSYKTVTFLFPNFVLICNRFVKLSN